MKLLKLLTPAFLGLALLVGCSEKAPVEIEPGVVKAEAPKFEKNPAKSTNGGVVVPPNMSYDSLGKDVAK